MPSIRVKENENFDYALRRFKRAVEKAGTVAEAREREFYEKPTQIRKRKAAAAVKDDNRPKRPLSSYNLFYRFKRLKLLEAYDRGETSKESTRRLIAATPGLESYPFLQEAMKGIEEGAFEGATNHRP